MTKRSNHSFTPAFLAVSLCLGCGLFAGAAAQTTPSDPNMREFADGPAGTPCDTARGLPCDRTPPHLIGLPDPTEWSVAGRGRNKVYYRRATAAERRANRWNVGAFLVVGPGAGAATKGKRTATFAIPLDDRTVSRVELELDERVEGLEFYERIGVPGSPNNEIVSRVRRPVLFEYFNKGFDPREPRLVEGAWARIVASDDGGLFASGVAGGFELEIDGPGGGWDIDRLPGPGAFKPNPEEIVKVQILSLGTFGGTQYSGCASGLASEACEWICAEIPGVPCENNPHIGPSSNHHCADGVDNDVDGKVDGGPGGDADCIAQSTETYDWGDSIHPGFPKRHWESGNSYALFGEGRFCTQYAMAEFNDNGTKVSGNWINRLTAMGWDAEGLLNAAVGFFGVTGREKQYRYRAGGCWIFESMEAAEDCTNNGTSCLSGYPYADAGSTASHYYNSVWDDVHHATYGGLDDALHLAQTVYWGGTSGAGGTPLFCEDGAGCCGATPTNGGADEWGSSVVKYQNGCNAGDTLAHEIGHSSGLDHVAIQSFMHSPSNHNPALPPAEKNMLRGCVEAADCPRPSGFRYHPF